MEEELAWASGRLAACGPAGIPAASRRPSRARGSPQPLPTRGQPPPVAAPRCAAPRPRLAAEGHRGRRLTGERAGAGERRQERSTAQSSRTRLLRHPPSVLESSARPAPADFFCSPARARHSPEVPPLSAATTPRLPGRRRGGHWAGSGCAREPCGGGLKARFPRLVESSGRLSSCWDLDCGSRVLERSWPGLPRLLGLPSRGRVPQALCRRGVSGPPPLTQSTA